MNWQFKNDQPIYTQLVGQLSRAIVAGEFLPGQRLDSVRDLSAQAGVNPNTMQRALAQLEQDGLVYSQRTAGRFVTQEKAMIEKTKKEIAKGHLDEFVGAMQALGITFDEMISYLEKKRGE